MDLILTLECHLRVLKECPDIACDLNLARVRTGGVMNERVERGDCANHGFGAYRCANLREQREVNGLIKSKRSDGRRESSAVQDTEVLLGRERDRSNAVVG